MSDFFERIDVVLTNVSGRVSKSMDEAARALEAASAELHKEFNRRVKEAGKEAGDVVTERELEVGDAVTTSMGNYTIDALAADLVTLKPSSSNKFRETLHVPRSALLNRRIWFCRDVVEYMGDR